jgi:hypothetical protein
MPSSSAVAGAANHAVTLRDAERVHILRTLEQTRWVMGGAAGATAHLGLKRTTLQALLKRLGLERPRARRHLGTCQHVGSPSSSRAPESPSQDGESPPVFED